MRVAYSYCYELLLVSQAFDYQDGRGTNCTDTNNSPSTNFFAETYALGSRCVEHGRQWTWTSGRQTATPTTYGGGCYQVSSVKPYSSCWMHNDPCLKVW